MGIFTFIKKSLRQSFRDIISPYFKFIVINNIDELSKIEKPYILWSSDIATTDWNKILPLCTKLSYSSDNIEIQVGNSKLFFNLAYKTKDILYLKNEDYLIQINNSNIYKLTHNNLLSRYFNLLKTDGEKIYKKSNDKEKIYNEYTYLSNLPSTVKEYFVEVFDYTEELNGATYSSQKYNMVDSSFLYLNNGLSKNNLDVFLNSITNFMSEKQKLQEVKSKDHIQELLINKTQERFNQLKQWVHYNSLNIFIYEYTSYQGLEDVLNTLYKLIKKDKKELDKYLNVFSHGDLCLSNILYDKNTAVIKLIDPKGLSDMYMSSIL